VWSTVDAITEPALIAPAADLPRIPGAGPVKPVGFARRKMIAVTNAGLAAIDDRVSQPVMKCAAMIKAPASRADAGAAVSRDATY